MSFLFIVRLQFGNYVCSSCGIKFYLKTRGPNLKHVEDGWWWSLMVILAADSPQTCSKVFRSATDLGLICHEQRVRFCQIWPQMFVPDRSPLSTPDQILAWHRSGWVCSVWPRLLETHVARSGWDVSQMKWLQRRSQGGPRGPGLPPIKIPPMIKNYDNIA